MSQPCLVAKLYQVRNKWTFSLFPLLMEINFTQPISSWKSWWRRCTLNIVADRSQYGCVSIEITFLKKIWWRRSTSRIQVSYTVCQVYINRFCEELVRTDGNHVTSVLSLDREAGPTLQSLNSAYPKIPTPTFRLFTSINLEVLIYVYFKFQVVWPFFKKG